MSESQQQKRIRLNREHRARVMQASAQAIEEIDRVLGSCMEVVTPIHPAKEHFHGETPLGEDRDETLPAQDQLEPS
jgi:hypothetical protein